MESYTNRIVDDEFRQLLDALPALSLEGAKGVGKTSTASQRARTIFQLDNPATMAVIEADPRRLIEASKPVLIDEWQRLPTTWDLVRRAVDARNRPGQFILAGSATPSAKPTHSGAGRITRVRMRPLTLLERGVATPTVSLKSLLSGTHPSINGETPCSLKCYVDEILRGGFPGMRHDSERAQRAALDGYIERIVDSDLPELGISVRNPNAVMRWLRAYGAATSTVTSLEKISLASASGESPPPTKPTTQSYREALERLWLLDAVPAWTPSVNHLKRLSLGPKHHLVDPALAARLVGVNREALLNGEGPTANVREGTFLGALFESLATLSVRVFAQDSEAKVSHFRTWQGEHEIDLIVSRGDQRVVAVECKLTASVNEDDVRQLVWLKSKLGDNLLDSVILTTGPSAYRRPDGIAVVPLALLGP